MKTRRLGELVVSGIGLGCMGLSHANGAPTKQDEAIKLLRDAYFKEGYTFFDTAETYGYKEDPHHNEKLLGEAFKDIRENVIIATKFGVAFDYSDEDHPGLILDSSPETIRKSVDESLERLQTDYIDLYFQHRIDPNVSPEEVALVMKELMDQGKIRHWGISMADEDYLRRADAVCKVSAIQNLYSMVNREDSKMFKVCEELNVGYVSVCPLAKGLLSGKYSKGEQFESSDYRSQSAWFSDESMDRYQPVIDKMHELSIQKNATPAQISMAWMTSKKDFIVPIPGTRKLSRLHENAGAANVVLTQEEISALDKLLEEVESK